MSLFTEDVSLGIMLIVVAQWGDARVKLRKSKSTCQVRQ